MIYRYVIKASLVIEFEKRRVDDLGSPLTLYTVMNRINDQRCYIAIIFYQFECITLLQKTPSNEIQNYHLCWFYLWANFNLQVFFFHLYIIFHCQSVCAGGGGGRGGGSWNKGITPPLKKKNIK